MASPSGVLNGLAPPVAVFQIPGRSGGILVEALSQEGIACLDLPLPQLDALFAGQYPGVRLAVVASAPGDAQRAALKRWVDQGGAAILMNSDTWPAAELAAWFGLQQTLEDTDGGYLWPSSPALAFPALANQQLQISGRRMLYRLPPGISQTLAQGSSHPSAAIAFDANRDGFSDDEWFWVGQSLCRFARGRSLIEDSVLPGVGFVTPTTATTGDFTGDGFKDNLLIARGPYYAILKNGVWAAAGQMPANIRHALSFDAGTPIWPINLFLEDGSLYTVSLDGGVTWGPLQVFAPDGVTPVPTDFGYSYEAFDDYGYRRTVLNLWSQGAFYTNFGSGWTPVATLPDLGPKYLVANVLRPTLGYASDSGRTGIRDQISLLVGSNVYARDPATNTFNYPQQYHKLYKSGRHPLIVRNGRAVAFLYDFETTVLRLQQGMDVDPAIAVQLVQISTLGQPLVFSPVINAFDDWIDYTQLDLPQADLHERILRQLVTSLVDTPVPRVWYLPNGYHSVASLSHDIETAGPNQRTTVEIASMTLAETASKYNRRDTFFVLMTSGDAGLMSAADLAALAQAGHHVTIHFDSLGSTDFTPANLQLQANALRTYGVNAIQGNRSHGLSWVKDYLAQAMAAMPEIIYDSTFGGGPGYSHCGSVLPYRIYSAAGPAFESFLEISHGLMDISDTKFFYSGTVPEGQLALQLDDLFTRARDMATSNHDLFYGVFDCLFHPVVVAGLTPPIAEFLDMFDEYASFLDAQQIPTMTLLEVAEWWVKRRAVQVLGLRWDQGGQLQFAVRALQPVDQLTLVLAADFAGKTLQNLSDAQGNPVDFRVEMLDGQNHGVIVLPRIEQTLQLVATFV
ncbi:MAG: hypothetical protein HYZ57_10205 [Acidobacteria bacterium]|nr:hypothetical protein [Acidobacteriota bacterium]